MENQLYLGYPELFNTTRKDCVWRDVTKHEHLCPKEVQMELLSNGQQEKVKSIGAKDFHENYRIWIISKNVEGTTEGSLCEIACCYRLHLLHAVHAALDVLLHEEKIDVKVNALS